MKTIKSITLGVLIALVIVVTSTRAEILTVTVMEDSKEPAAKVTAVAQTWDDIAAIGKSKTVALEFNYDIGVFVAKGDEKNVAYWVAPGPGLMSKTSDGGTKYNLHKIWFKKENPLKAKQIGEAVTAARKQTSKQ